MLSTVLSLVRRIRSLLFKIDLATEYFPVLLDRINKSGNQNLAHKSNNSFTFQIYNDSFSIPSCASKGDSPSNILATKVGRTAACSADVHILGGEVGVRIRPLALEPEECPSVASRRSSSRACRARFDNRNWSRQPSDVTHVSRTPLVAYPGVNG